MLFEALHQNTALTEGHRNQAHDSLEGHGWLVVVVYAIAIGSQPILLIVVRMSRNPFIGLDMLNVVL